MLMKTTSSRNKISNFYYEVEQFQVVNIFAFTVHCNNY